MRTPALPLLRSLAAEGQLVHTERLPARPAHTAELAAPTRAEVWDAFGVPSLWTHQAAAVNLVRQQQSVVVATGTASGKSLCYQAADRRGRHLDSGRAPRCSCSPPRPSPRTSSASMSGLGLPGLVAATYDGDTGPEDRSLDPPQRQRAAHQPGDAARRASSRTTGDGPRSSCACATWWSTSCTCCAGVFGIARRPPAAAPAPALRALRRRRRPSCSPRPRSASPAAWPPTLCGLAGRRRSTDDGSPRGERLVALWNPPLLDEDDGRAGRPNTETRRAGGRADRRRVTTRSTFCRSRRGTEVVAADVRKRLPERPRRRASRSYRAGYLAAERREIEAELFSRPARGVVATSALELGIDVGGLDAVRAQRLPGHHRVDVAAGGPGRARRQDRVAVLVAGDDQLDQWLMTHPAEVFTRPPEPAVVNPANPIVLRPAPGLRRVRAAAGARRRGVVG